jgi:hypothetical protein
VPPWLRISYSTPDAAVDELTGTFETQIAADPGRYGISEQEAADFATNRARWTAAYQATLSRTTRTPASITARQTRKRSLINGLKTLVGVAENWPEMTNDLRSELNLRIRDREPTPIPAPTQAPLCILEAVSGHLFFLKLRDVEAPTRRRRPANAKMAYLYTFAGDEPATDVREWKFEGGFTRTDLQVEMPPMLVPGTKIHFAACWVGTRGEFGPFSRPIMARINFDDVAQAA